MANKKENQIITYATPLNAAKVKSLAEKRSTSVSKVVNDALTEYFKKPEAIQKA